MKNTQGADTNKATTKGTLIFEDPYLCQGFAQIPNIVLRDSNLQPSGKVLYALLISYAWHTDECFPGQDTLAQHMGCSRQYVNSWLLRLKAHKLISWKRQGLGKSNVYIIRRLAEAYPQIVDKGAQG